VVTPAQAKDSPTVVIVAASTKLNDLWLTRDYFPAMARTRRPEIQPEHLAAQLGGTVRIEPLPRLPRRLRRGVLGSA